VTSDRPYRKAEERRQALALLQAGAGRGFDPRVVRAFVRMMGLFPIGALVELDGGEVGVVVRNHQRLLARPVLRLVLDQHGNPCEPSDLDLAETGSKGDFTRTVRRTLVADEVGIDMLSFLSAGRVDEPRSAAAHLHGLMHEPAPGEELPPGYVEDHTHPSLPR
jgi:hypothetical protein